MSHFPRNLLHSTVFDRCFVQMLGTKMLMLMLIRLPRIQAGDKLHQHHASPNSRHKWFPTHLCTALQHDHNVMNWRNLQYGQLLLQKYELIGYWRTNNLNNCYDYTDWIDSQSEYFKIKSTILHWDSLLRFWQDKTIFRLKSIYWDPLNRCLPSKREDRSYNWLNRIEIFIHFERHTE